MAINLRHWACVLSACTLGWVCGFIFYATVLYGSAISAVATDQQNHLPTAGPHQKLLPFKHGQSSTIAYPATVQHAIVRIVTPERTDRRLQTSRSYYL